MGMKEQMNKNNHDVPEEKAGGVGVGGWRAGPDTKTYDKVTVNHGAGVSADKSAEQRVQTASAQGVWNVRLHASGEGQTGP